MAESEENKYLTIGKLSKITAVAKHSLRHWESKFKLLSPVRTTNGHRRYTKDHIEKILLIKDLIYRQKMTLEGVKKYIHGRNKTTLTGEDSKTTAETLKNLTQIHKELSAILKEW